MFKEHIWAVSREKRPKGNFDQNVYFSIFWMYIILRLICEILSRIAVKISFLWGRKHGVYAASSFAASITPWYLHNDMQNFTSVMLYKNIICIAQWLLGISFEILHYCGAFAWRQ